MADRTTLARFALALVGVLAIQAAWVGALPPFRGIDEHDHVYRADSVAAGQWVSPGVTVDEGRGEILSVRRSIVEAAGPVCESLSYTGRFNCQAYASDGADRVEVASAAALYHPAFYWAIGTAALPFDGADAVYAMRATTALLCALLIAWAMVLLWRRSGSWWLPVGVAVVLTPTTTYSTAVAAPNGVEMAGALLSWVALLGMARRIETGARIPRHLAAAAAVGLVVVSTTRSLGPLWAALIVGAAVLTVPWATLVAGVRRQPRAICLPVAFGAVGAVAGAAWSVLSGTNNPAETDVSVTGSAWPGVLSRIPLWVFQTVAAFPRRSEAAPAPVYALALVVAAVLLVAAWRVATSRIRAVMVLGVTASVVLPIIFTSLSYADLAYAWQGRYTWPLAMGVPLLAVTALSVRGDPPRAGHRWLAVACVAGVAVATAIGQVAVLEQELDTSPLSGDPSWATIPAPVIAALTLAGFGLVLLALRPATADRSAPSPSPL